MSKKTKKSKKSKKIAIINLVINIILLTALSFLETDIFKIFYAINGAILTPFATLWLCEFFIEQ